MRTTLKAELGRMIEVVLSTDAPQEISATHMALSTSRRGAKKPRHLS